MTEKPLQVYYVKMLVKLQIPFLHLTNKGLQRGTYHDSSGESCLKHISDIIFPYGTRLHFREFGVPGRHKERKRQQVLKAEWWLSHVPGDVKVIEDIGMLQDDWRELGWQ